MQQFKFASILLCSAMLFVFVSCNNESGADKAATADTTVTTSDAPTTPVAANTIVTTPQNMMVVYHKVTDFDKWLVAYEGHDSARLANGIHKYVIGRGTKDPSMVLIAMRVDDIAKAKAFGNDPKLKDLMKNAGVVGKPNFWYGVLVFQDTATLSTPLRVRTTLTVKDWDTWEKSFLNGRQMRLDNGLVDRVYGYEADNNKKIIIVTAPIDTTKAFAFWKSAELKKRMEESGVVGAPDRFVYTTVKRY